MLSCTSLCRSMCAGDQWRSKSCMMLVQIILSQTHLCFEYLCLWCTQHCEGRSNTIEIPLCRGPSGMQSYSQIDRIYKVVILQLALSMARGLINVYLCNIVHFTFRFVSRFNLGFNDSASHFMHVQHFVGQMGIVLHKVTASIIAYLLFVFSSSSSHSWHNGSMLYKMVIS